MTKSEQIKKIEWKIWALNQSINHLENIYHISKDSEFKKGTRDQITQMEDEKRALYKKWEDLNK